MVHYDSRDTTQRYKCMDYVISFGRCLRRSEAQVITIISKIAKHRMIVIQMDTTILRRGLGLNVINDAL